MSKKTKRPYSRLTIDGDKKYLLVQLRRRYKLKLFGEAFQSEGVNVLKNQLEVRSILDVVDRHFVYYLNRQYRSLVYDVMRGELTRSVFQKYVDTHK